MYNKKLPKDHDIKPKKKPKIWCLRMLEKLST